MKRAVAAVLTALLGAAVVAASVVLLSHQQAEPPTLTAALVGTSSTAKGTLPHATVELSIFPNSSASQPGPTVNLNDVSSEAASQAWPFYSPSSTIQIPAHSLVTFTVHQYDTGGDIYNPWLATVQGTVDGAATFNGKAQSAIDPKNVAHTFTIHQYAESTQPYLYVNVPFPAQADNAPNEANGYPKPFDITFSFITGDPGDYVWNCEFPCGSGYVSFGGPMSQRGWMSGTLKVV